MRGREQSDGGVDRWSRSDWWGVVLDAPDDDFRLLCGERVNLSLQLADTPVTARDQMHLDLYSDDADAQVERLVALGARKIRVNDDPQDTYVVMADPEGNEFCVCSPPST